MSQATDEPPKSKSAIESIPNLNQYGQMALEHLQRFRPTEYKELKASGQLKKHLWAMQDKAMSEITDLVSQGLQEFEAKEIVLPRYILTTPEKIEQQEENPNMRLNWEMQNEINKALAEL